MIISFVIYEERRFYRVVPGSMNLEKRTSWKQSEKQTRLD